MAFTLASLQSTQLEEQRLGFISISTTEWTTANEDDITAGSSFECASSVYYCAGDETIDSTATLAGLGNSWVYVYFSPATLQLYCSATAPAWDDAKQGHYLAASPTHRCLFIFYKIAAGNYANKIIPTDRETGIQYNRSSVQLPIISNVRYVYDTNKTENEIYDLVSPFINTTSDRIPITGSFYFYDAAGYRRIEIPASAYRQTSTKIAFCNIDYLIRNDKQTTDTDFIIAGLVTRTASNGSTTRFISALAGSTCVINMMW